MIFRTAFLPALVALIGAAAGRPSLCLGQEPPKQPIYTVPKGKAPQDAQSQQPPQGQPQQQPQAPVQQGPDQPPRGAAPSSASSPEQPSLPPPYGSQAPRRDQANGTGSGPPLTETLLKRELGAERFRKLLGQLERMSAEAATGRGAPMADVWFDGARPRTGNDDGLRPSGTRFFAGGSQAPTVTTGSYKPATVADADATTGKWGSIPGGIVLDGVAEGLGEINTLRYDSRFNAFILNDRAVYFVKVPQRSVAVLCRAIAQDEKERVGVSLGDVELVYGKVPGSSDLAWDLKVADHFLGDIVFAQNEWTPGYRFANGFTPEPDTAINYNVAVFFTFNGFGFQLRNQHAVPTRVNLDVRLFPLTESRSPDGGLLPDAAAISRGLVSAPFERNARHVAENIGYYRRERIIERVFAYGEVAAFIRELKRSGFDLEDLARNIPGGME